MVDTWNSLPTWLVLARDTNTFKHRLQPYWQNQDIIYDFCAQLQGTRSHSEVLSYE